MDLKEKLEEARLNIKRLKKELKVAMRSELMPAGTYFIGDPSYILSHKAYDNLADQIPCGKPSSAVAVYGVLGRHVAVLKLQSDGTYEDTEGFEYMVDSASIGAVELSATGSATEGDELKIVSDPNDSGALECLVGSRWLPFGRIAHFAEPFKCSLKLGKASFGSVVIIVEDESDGDE
jgi:hypothetical protein